MKVIPFNGREKRSSLKIIIIVTSSNQRSGIAFYRICSVIVKNWVVRKKAKRKLCTSFLRMCSFLAMFCRFNGASGVGCISSL